MDDLYIEDEYPRRSNKYFKPALKGEIRNPVLSKWIKGVNPKCLLQERSKKQRQAKISRGSLYDRSVSFFQ